MSSRKMIRITRNAEKRKSAKKLARRKEISSKMGFFDSLGDALSSIGSGIGTVIGGTVDVVGTVAGTALDVAGTAITTTAKVAVNTVEGAGRAIKATAEGNFGDAFGEVANTVGKGMIGTVIDGATEATKQVGKGAGNALTTTGKTLWDTGTHAVNALGHTAKATGHGFKNIGDAMAGSKD